MSASDGFVSAFPVIRALAFSVLATGAPHAPVQPIVVHLSPTQTCVATDISYLYSGGVQSLTITGLVCAADLIFANNFEVTK